LGYFDADEIIGEVFAALFLIALPVLVTTVAMAMIKRGAVSFFGDLLEASPLDDSSKKIL
jgi:hypothetical protein